MKTKTKLFRFLKLNNRILPVMMLLVLSLIGTTIYAQPDYCDFDENMSSLMGQYPELYQIMQDNENEMQAMMAGNPQAIMNNNVYVVPVVFHVIHLGEPLGVGSNLPDSRLLQTLADLNANFRDVAGLGYDMEIEFCLAQQDPDGNNSTGINRVDGTGTGNYENIGIAQGANDGAIKNLSIWPNDSYVNIWVVHNIQSGSGGQTLGYATFPGSPASVDGIVMLEAATGVASQSGVIAHELGHFFNLYHTFQGGNQTTCPPNNNCQLDGDMVCDTPPHKLVFGGCNTSGLNDCDGNSSLSLVVHNHMNYTSNACRTEFTPEQVMRARCALMTLRPGLMNSIGCQPGCTTTVADFTVPAVDINIGTTLNFTNTSTNGSSFSWLLDGEEMATSTNWSYTFNEGGIYQVCLDATGPGCMNRTCKYITAIPVCIPPDPCNIGINTNFEQIEEGLDPNSFENVCGWRGIQSSPFFCDDDQNNSIGLWLRSGDIERITSEDPIGLQLGKTYTISFDYWVTLSSPTSIQIALIDNNDPSSSNGSGLPGNATVIAQVDNPGVDDSSQNNNTCPEAGAVFHNYTGTFTYTDPNNVYLTLTGENTVSVTSIVFVDNIVITDCGPACTPVPDFEFTVSECGTEFMGTNTGDDGTYFWNFDNLGTATGPNATFVFPFGGTFDVCLTITCDVEASATICKEVTILDFCNSCDTIPTITSYGLCAAPEDTTVTYISNFSFEVPKGAEPCVDDNLYVDSDDVGVVITSYDIDDSDPLMDVVHVAILVTAPVGYDLDDAVINAAFCFGDELRCLSFKISSRDCDQCETITALLICEDDDIADTILYYEGTAIVTLPDDDYTFCGEMSTDLGFTLENLTQNGTEWTIDYSVTTDKEGEFNLNALFCFENGDGDQVCITLDIKVDDPCVVLPEECVAVWTTKTMECTGQEGDYIYIDITNMSVFAANYSICDIGLFGTVDGGEVIVNYGQIIGQYLHFDLTILLPVGYDQNLVYDVRLFLCDASGNIVCYLFPYKFPCLHGEGGDDKGDKGEGFGGLGGDRSGYNGYADSDYSIFPNPVSDKLLVVSRKYNAEQEVRMELIDQLGRVVAAGTFNSEQFKLDVNGYQSGIYFIRIYENDVPVKNQKIVIVN